ncbi:Ribosomal RNA small subunit methyltransferase E [Spiroplasma sp. JKS002669]|uniref:RsmE family RNA methyltransferase n=1 Tax=Spiroplasma attinicola TaxID=2904537 RepID=UPI0020BE433A|nr:16S rRNA (uracil(1498)-N(3))-methyltransferase [Spiroplasma sp. JKS002669]MCL6428517.1 Ribosomal RNA small subunit methyltransferase E [Spiroplasma sp. JKS002669]
MESYFATIKNKKGQLVLDLDDSKHIIKVLRHQINDEIIVNFQAEKYLTKIVALMPNVICQIIEPLKENNELPIKVTLVMALLKEQKFDLVIQKAVELGVNKIVPIQLKYCVSIVNNKITQKVARWQKIAKAAAKQANRNIIPEVTSVVKNIEDLKQYQSEVNFLAYENENFQDWTQNLTNINSITIVVGPEGGISPDELTSFKTLNFTNISLGLTILRAETAPLYFLSVVNYHSLLKK